MNVGSLRSEADDGRKSVNIDSYNGIGFSDEEDNQSISIRTSCGTDNASPCIELSKNGTKYEEVSITSKGITIQEGQVQAIKVLYNNTSGTTGTITLSESSANFSYIEIFFAWGAEKSIKVSAPNGKAVELQTGLCNNNTTIQKFKRMKISGTTISAVNDYVGSLNTWNNSVSTENVIIVYKVVGYK